jgi:hypothetical protein
VTSRWEVIFYEDQDGHSPVQEYILEDNDPKKIAILIAVIQRLESVGADLQGTNMDKQIEVQFGNYAKTDIASCMGEMGIDSSY